MIRAAAGLALGAVLAVTACSSGGDAPSPPDAGGYPSFGDAAPGCTPGDVHGFRPRAYKPPRPGGACTAAEIAAYVGCSVDRDPASCRRILDAEGRFLPSFQACGPCVETQASDDAWGAIVLTDPLTRAGFYNLAGCFGKRAGDGASVTGCGAASRALVECWSAACAACTTDPSRVGDVGFRNACLDAASKGACAAYDADFEAKCAKVIHDGVTADACSGGQAATDGQFLTAIVTEMCGGAPSAADAGTD